MEDQFKEYNIIINKILRSKKFNYFYNNFKENKNEKNYNDLKDYLTSKSKKNKVELALTDSNGKLTYDSKSKNSFERYVTNRITPSNKYLEEAYKASDKYGKSSIYFSE